MISNELLNFWNEPFLHKILGEGSYGEVVKAEMKFERRSDYPNFDSYEFAIKRVLKSFINREAQILNSFFM